jgi:uncharacterized protein (UPF0276 family)
MAAFSTLVDDLPVLGVGASLSFGVQPDPVALAEHPRGPSFIEYAGAVQHTFLAGPMNALKKLGVPLLYHPSCLNLCGPWRNPASWLDAVDAHVKAAGSPWLAQDVAVCFATDTPGYSIQLGYFVPPILTERTLTQAVERVSEVQERVQAPLLLEPAPVTFVAGDMDIFTWLGGLAERTDSGLLLDAGHVVSHQLARGAALDEGLDVLDLDRVIEMHIAGGVIEVDEGTGRQVYLDAHDLPILPETWQVARTLLERCTNLRAVCVECEGTLAGAVLPMLEQCRQRVEAITANPALREVVDAELARGS